jgi:sialate O-acetylesterase
MAWPLRLTTHGRQTLSHPRINDSKLRLFRVPQQISTSPKTFLTRGRWTASNAVSAQHFSAVCYYFGQRLRQHRKLPVGLIQSAWGGTKIQAWIPHKALRADSRFRGIFRRHRMRRPHANSPSVLYNGMIAPVAPYGIRGALWYQGESDIYRAFMYRWSFPLLIEQWRLAWGKQFPFLYVQLAPYNYRRWRLKQGTYNELCEAQRRTLQSTFRTGMATTNDVGNIYDIHPRRKRIVAHRLYRLTRKHAYREAFVETGPLYTSFRRKGKGLLVSFQHVGKGLMAKGGTLRFFEVAGKDRRYWPAKAKIVGKQVFVWSTHVKQPVAVRFAWRDDIAHHLFNREGLPAAPFRSDRWPRITQYRR